MKKVLFALPLLALLAVGCVKSQPINNSNAPAQNKNQAVAPAIEQPIGGQKDEHGCLGPAGYSWCAAKNKCIRPWEQYCTAASPTTAIFKCDGAKTIAATFYPTDDKYVDLVLSDGRNMSVPHAISADGARYANTDESFVFWNVGETAFITESNTTTFANCAVSPVAGADTEPALQNPGEAALGATSYDLTVPDNDQKTLDISLNGKLVKHLTASDLPAPYNKIIPYKTDYEFDTITNDKASLDKARNRIYFFTMNSATAGNVNAEKVIFAYDITSNKVLFISDRPFTNGGDPIELSPDDHYMVFREGGHGGMCNNGSWLVVFDLVANKDKADVTPAGNDQVGLYTFDRWIDNTSFSYASETQSQEQCMANDPVSSVQKIYKIDK